MRKMMIFLLTALLLLTASCSAEMPEATEASTEVTIPATEAPTDPPTEAPTEAPTEPVPECTDALVQVDDAPAILILLSRGDIVDVVGEYDEDHYVIKTVSGYGLVEKQLLRPSGEPAYEGWTGYAKGNAPLYGHYQLTGEAVQTLGLNAQLEVLEELEYCYVVNHNEQICYIQKEQVSKSRIPYGGGGGGGGGGADGGDISLSYGGIFTLAAIEQSGEVTGTAEVLVDNAQVILGYFSRGDVASVVTEEGFAPAWEGYHILYMNGIYAYIPVGFVQTEDMETFTQWDGFAGYDAYVYDNYLLQGEGTRISINTNITILWDSGAYYVVSINGEIGYMAAANVGQNRFATGGGGGGGGDWTPPAM